MPPSAKTTTTLSKKPVAEVHQLTGSKQTATTPVETVQKSSLRDYRRPAKNKIVPPPSSASAASEFARALSGSEVSVTAVVGVRPKQPPPPAKQQPAIVSMFPVPVSTGLVSSSSTTTGNNGRVPPIQGMQYFS